MSERSETGDAEQATARRPRRRRVLLAIGILVLALLVLLGWLVVRGLQARDALLAARSDLGQIRTAVEDQDFAAARARIAPLQEHAAAARAAGDDPVWRLAAHVPWGGANLEAITVVGRALDLAAQEALPPAIDAVEIVTGLRLEDGGVDLEPLQEAAPRLERAAEASARAREMLDGIDTAALHEQVAGPVEQAQDALADADEALQSAAVVADVVPGLLGADGARSYLLLFLNSAELRSPGGMPGALAVITAEDGRLALSDQRTAAGLGGVDEPVLELTAEEIAVYGDGLGRYMQNTVLTPHFPRAAELAREMWRRATGQEVDGVIATDLVALSYVLAATGPVSGPDGVELAADSLVRELLYESYIRMDPAQTDEFFAASAVAVFDALTGGQGDPLRILDALSRGVDERRVLAWSAHPAEQDLIAGTPLAGAFLDDPAAIGLFLNDGTAAKMSYFLRPELDVVSVVCTPDGGARVTIGLELRSLAPAQVALLPTYIAGDGRFVPVGTIRTRVTLFSPRDGALGPATRDGAALGGSVATQEDREVVSFTSDLRPGQSERYELEVTVPPGGPAERVEILGTPTIYGPGVVAVERPCG